MIRVSSIPKALSLFLTLPGVSFSSFALSLPYSFTFLSPPPFFFHLYFTRERSLYIFSACK